MDILDKLEDLHKQATTELTHYYVGSCCREAITEITTLRKRLELAEAAMHGYRKMCKIQARPVKL